MSRPPAAELVDRISAITLATPGVVALHAGRFGEVGTYLPGRRVAGIRIDERGTQVHITVAAGHPIRQVAHRVQHVVAQVAPTP